MLREGSMAFSCVLVSAEGVVVEWYSGSKLCVWGKGNVGAETASTGIGSLFKNRQESSLCK